MKTLVFYNATAIKFPLSGSLGVHSYWQSTPPRSSQGLPRHEEWARREWRRWTTGWSHRLPQDWAPHVPWHITTTCLRPFTGAGPMPAPGAEWPHARRSQVPSYLVSLCLLFLSGGQTLNNLQTWVPWRWWLPWLLERGLILIPARESSTMK